MHLSSIKTPNTKNFFPIRRTSLPQCDINKLDKKNREFKIQKLKVQKISKNDFI